VGLERLRFLRFQNGTVEYFGVNLEPIYVDIRAAAADAICCGVNLAFACFGVVGFSAG
jgi:hypothetical protein